MTLAACTKQIEECGAQGHVKMKIYHVVVKDKRNAMAAHLMIRTTAKAHAKTGRVIRKLLASLTIQ